LNLGKSINAKSIADVVWESETIIIAKTPQSVKSIVELMEDVSTHALNSFFSKPEQY